MGMGKFIVFEGIDGCGKSTQIRMLSERLAARGRQVQLTAEPTATDTGKMLREALSGRVQRSAFEMAALFTLDRIAHNVGKGGIEEMLKAGAENALMSGSGPTVFGIFIDESKAKSAEEQIRQAGLAKQVFVTGFCQR